MEFLYPTLNNRITQRFGERKGVYPYGSLGHRGTDYGAIQRGIEGDRLFAVADGVVKSVSRGLPYYGNQVIISMRGGWAAEYSHCNNIVVKAGDNVNMGQTIAFMGDTDGGTNTNTAVHLHFVLKRFGIKVDPEKYLNMSYNEFMKLLEKINKLEAKATALEEKMILLEAKIAKRPTNYKTRKIAKKKANEKINKRVKKDSLKTKKK